MPGRHRPPLRVLIADDNAVNRKLYSAILRRRGHEVITAEDGRAALEAMRESTLDLVLMDVEMPQLDGTQATASFRSGESAGSHLWIVALTAHQDQRTRFTECGMDEVLVKPVRPAELDALIDRLLPAADPFDRLDALQRLDGDEALLHELIGVFVEDYPRTLADIHAALDRADLGALAFSAHKLAGTLGSVSAAPAQQAARLVEAAARDDPGAAGAALHILEARLRELMTALEAAHLVR